MKRFRRLLSLFKGDRRRMMVTALRPADFPYEASSFMRHRRPSTHVILVAFATIVGMLSLADIGSACTTKAAAMPAACCVDRPKAACGCCTSGQLPTPVADADAIVSAPARVPFQASTPACECRESQPAAPSERQAPRTTSERNDVQGVGSFAVYVPPAHNSPSPGHVRLPNESPPESPIYLRTSRLRV